MSKILLIGPSFFGYRDTVAAEIRRLGNDVDCVDDRPSESTLFKSVAKFGYTPLESAISNYANVLAERVAEKCYDLIAYLGGMTFCFTRKQLARIRKAANAPFVAVLWDAVDNSPRLELCLDLFDRVLSFEPADCETFSFGLRPLFHTYTGDSPEVSGKSFEYDACFIGSVHQPSKFAAVRSIVDGLRGQGFKVFAHYYMPSRLVAALRVAQYACYRGTDFAFEPLSTKRTAEIYTRSRAVIDSPQAHQHGLTMRTIEAIGAGRKLVTTNTDVRNYDFYEYGNVSVWDGGVSDDFFERPCVDLPAAIYRSYSTTAFSLALLGEGSMFTGYKRFIR